VIDNSVNPYTGKPYTDEEIAAGKERREKSSAAFGKALALTFKLEKEGKLPPPHMGEGITLEQLKELNSGGDPFPEGT
jgi:hypothetical protein